MSFGNKLVRTVSYSVLLSGLVLAASAKAASLDITTDTILDADTTFASGDKLNINDSTYGYSADENAVAHKLTLEEGSVTNISGNGEKAAGIGNIGELVINGGTVTANGAGEFDLDKTAQVAGYAGVEMNGGTVNLNGNSIMFSGATADTAAGPFTGHDVVINDGTVNLNGGTIFAPSKTTGDAALQYNGKIDLNGGAVNVANGQLISENINLAGGTINNNGTLNLYKSRASANAALTGDKLGAADGSLDMTEGTYNSNNGTLNGSLKIDGTAVVDAAGTDAEKLAAAPKANFYGNNTIVGDVSNTKGLMTIAEGASLTADKGIVNNGYIDVSGKLDSAVTGAGNVAVKSSNANIKSIAGNALEINANTSLSTLLNEDSSATQVYVDKGASFTIDDFGTDGQATFTAPELVTYGQINLAKDFAATKIKTGGIGTLNLGSHNFTGNVDMWGNSNLAFNVDKANNGVDVAQEGGKVTGAINLTESANLKPVVAIDAGSGTYQFADSLTKNGGVDQVWNLSNNNVLYDVTLKDDITLDINKKDSAAVAESVVAAGGNANDAAVVNAWVGGNSNATTLTGGAKDMAEHLNTLAQTSPETLVAATEALAPTTNATIQSTATENANQVFGAVGSRLSGGSMSTGGKGMSSGDNGIDNGAMWVQGLYNSAKLDDTSKGKGFDSDSTGIALGAEKNINDAVKLGLGYAYTNTDIDGFMRKTDVDTHTAILYGEYKPSQWYVNGIATYGWSDYSEKKNVAGLGVNADYDIDSIGLQAMTGYDMNFQGVDVTPEIGLRYVNIKQDSYQDSAGQTMGKNSSDILTGVAGITAGKDFALNNGMTLRPEARLAMTYDMVNDSSNSVVTLANGSAYSVDGQALDRFGIEAGAGLTADVNDEVELSVAYEGRFRQDYRDHTGLLSAKYKF